MTVPGRVRFLIGADLQEKAFQSPFSVSPKEREHWIGVPSFFFFEREREIFLGYMCLRVSGSIATGFSGVHEN